MGWGGLGRGVRPAGQREAPDTPVGKAERRRQRLEAERQQRSVFLGGLAEGTARAGPAGGSVDHSSGWQRSLPTGWGLANSQVP